MSLQIIKKLIERKQSQIRKVYPGLTCFKEGVRQIPVESIPGISKCLVGVQQTWVLMFLFNASYDLQMFLSGETGWKPSNKDKG